MWRAVLLLVNHNYSKTGLRVFLRKCISHALLALQNTKGFHSLETAIQNFLPIFQDHFAQQILQNLNRKEIFKNHATLKMRFHKISRILTDLIEFVKFPGVNVVCPVGIKRCLLEIVQLHRKNRKHSSSYLRCMYRNPKPIKQKIKREVYQRS